MSGANERVRHRALASGIVVVVALSVAAVSPACAELALSLELGGAYLPSRDLRVEGSDGTDVTFEDAAWSDESLQDPLWYALRLVRWRRPDAAWGVGISFTHAKAFLDPGQTRPARGEVAGRPVNGTEPVDAVLPRFGMSHGLNLLSVQALWRRLPGAGDWRERGRVVPFAAFGGGVAIPHVEARVGSVVTGEYQLGGPVLEAALGLESPLFESVSLVLEYRLVWSDVEVELDGGERVSVEPLVHQFALGLVLRR